MKMQSACANAWFESFPPILAKVFAGRSDKCHTSQISGSDEASVARTLQQFSGTKDKAAGEVAPGQSTRRPEIMVPVDFSPGSEAAADYAIEVAQCGHARLILLHAIYLNLTPYGPANPTWLRAALCREALEKMQGMMARAQNAGVPVISVIEEGAPARVIAQAAKRWKVALMVMAAKKRGKWARFLGQRIRKKVVRGAECPIIVMQTQTKKGATA